MEKSLSLSSFSFTSEEPEKWEAGANPEILSYCGYSVKPENMTEDKYSQFEELAEDISNMFSGKDLLLDILNTPMGWFSGVRTLVVVRGWQPDTLDEPLASYDWCEAGPAATLGVVKSIGHPVEEKINPTQFDVTLELFYRDNNGKMNTYETNLEVVETAGYKPYSHTLDTPEVNTSGLTLKVPPDKLICDLLDDNTERAVALNI